MTFSLLSPLSLLKLPIVKTGTDLCPWANLLKYLSQAQLSLPHLPTAAMVFFLVIFKPSPEGSLSAQLLNSLTLDVEKYF